VGVAHPLPCTSLEKNQTVQWTAKNHSESYEGWDFQKLGYSFNNGHLVGEHQRIHQWGWPCPIKPQSPVEGGKEFLAFFFPFSPSPQWGEG